MILVQAIPSTSTIPPLGLYAPHKDTQTEDLDIFLVSQSPQTWQAQGVPVWLHANGSTIRQEDNEAVTTFSYQVEKNSGETRSAQLIFTAGGLRCNSEVSQRGGAWVLLQVAAVMASTTYPPAPTRAEFPLAMELGILAKFLGKELSKLPPPLRAAALAILLLAVPALGAVIIALRGAMTEIPEPPDYFDQNSKAMTELLILQQVERFDAYLAQETANGGQ